MPDNAWIQYGCFGLLACLMVWVLWKGLPGLLTAHKEAIQILTDTFKAETTQCRADRKESEEKAQKERERLSSQNADQQKQLDELWRTVSGITRKAQ